MVLKLSLLPFWFRLSKGYFFLRVIERVTSIPSPLYITPRVLTCVYFMKGCYENC